MKCSVPFPEKSKITNFHEASRFFSKAFNSESFYFFCKCLSLSVNGCHVLVNQLKNLQKKLKPSALYAFEKIQESSRFQIFWEKMRNLLIVLLPLAVAEYSIVSLFRCVLTWSFSKFARTLTPKNIPFMFNEGGRDYVCHSSI